MESELHQGDHGIKNSTIGDKQVLRKSNQISNKAPHAISLSIGISAKSHVSPYKISHNMLAPKC